MNTYEFGFGQPAIHGDHSDNRGGQRNRSGDDLGEGAKRQKAATTTAEAAALVASTAAAGAPNEKPQIAPPVVAVAQRQQHQSIDRSKNKGKEILFLCQKM